MIRSQLRSPADLYIPATRTETRIATTILSRQGAWQGKQSQAAIREVSALLEYHRDQTWL